MTARERILALRLLQRQAHDPEYARRIGIQVRMIQKEPQNQEENDV